MDLEYYILSNDIPDDSEDAILETNGDEFPGFDQGISTDNKFLEGLTVKLSESIVPGILANRIHILGFNALVVSHEAKEFFEKTGIENIEFIPIEIIAQPVEQFEYPPAKILFIKIKHKQEPQEPVDYSGYFAANIIGLCECVDKEKSDLEYFGDGEEIDHIHSIVLDESQIPEELKIFRLKSYPDLIIVHESIVEAINKAGLTGFNFVAPKDFTEDIDSEDEE